MNKKGFTLTELLGVIVVLAVIVSIAGISAVSIMNKSKNKMYCEMEDNLKEAAISYLLSELSDNNKTQIDEIKRSTCKKIDGKTKCVGTCEAKVTIGTLKESGFFEEDKDYCEDKTEITVSVECGEEKIDGTFVEDYKATVPDKTCGCER